MPRTLTIFYLEERKEYWFTDQVFKEGDLSERTAGSSIVEAVADPNEEGNTPRSSFDPERGATAALQRDRVGGAPRVFLDCGLVMHRAAVETDAGEHRDEHRGQRCKPVASSVRARPRTVAGDDLAHRSDDLLRRNVSCYQRPLLSQC